MTRYFFAALVAIGVASAAHATTVEFFDGDFVSGWEFQTLVSPGDDGFVDPGTTGRIARITFQGLFSLSHTHTVVDDDRVFTVALNQMAVYDPSQQGAIGSIDISLDVDHCCFSGEVGWWLVLEQGGELFHGPLGTATVPDFTTLVMMGLGVADLLDVSTWFTNDTQGNMPDFSENGMPITFGYALSNTVADGIGSIDVQHRADNWSVTVNPVPLPAGVWLLLSGLGGLIGIRRLA